MRLYGRWCDATKEKDQRKHYWTDVEKDEGRDENCDDLAETVRSHYDRPERIAKDVERWIQSVNATRASLRVIDRSEDAEITVGATRIVGGAGE